MYIKAMCLSVNMRLSNPSLSPQDRIRMERFANWAVDIGEDHFLSDTIQFNSCKEWSQNTSDC